METNSQDYPLSVNNSSDLHPMARGQSVSPGRYSLNNRRILSVLFAGALLAALDASVLPSPAGAQTAQEGGDFTFRRVAPPGQGSGKRITVQIDPEAEVYRITPGSTPRRPGDPRPAAAFQLPDGLLPPGPAEYSWYWEVVSPALGMDPARRFADAIAAVDQAGMRIRTPRLQTLRDIADRHGVDILTSTIGTDVSPALVLAVIAVESAGRTDAVSHAGAQGLMQLIPATASRFGVSNSMDARQNIRGGVAYLDWLLNEFNGDPILALAGYNAGEGAVAKHGGVPPFAETRGYVPKVLAAWTVARSLCLTPPDLVSDGCVFVTASSAVR